MFPFIWVLIKRWPLYHHSVYDTCCMAETLLLDQEELPPVCDSIHQEITDEEKDGEDPESWAADDC